MATRQEELTDDQRRLLARLDEAVRRRADHARAEQEETVAIAALCVELRKHQTPMALLAEHVKVVGKEPDSELRPVSRQAVDQLVAHYENRERRPRRRRETHSPNGAIRLAAFE